MKCYEKDGYRLYLEQYWCCYLDVAGHVNLGGGRKIFIS